MEYDITGMRSKGNTKMNSKKREQEVGKEEKKYRKGQ